MITINSTLLQVLVSGILLGGIYSLVSVGLTLVFGVIRVINFAHGEFLMLAMFATLFAVKMSGANPYLTVLFIAPIFFVVGVLTFRLVIKPIIGSPTVTQIFATVGLSIVLQNLALLVWGPNYQAIQTQIASASIKLAGISISQTRLIAFVIAIAITVLLLLFLKYTYLGRAISAVAQDREAAKIVGIDVFFVYSLAFGIAIAITSIAGVILMPIYGVFPGTGAGFVLVSFVVVVIGGLGNVSGAIAGGIFIGLVEALSGYFLPVAFKEASYFLIFILVLWVRPAGLFGKRGFEQVGTQ